MEEVQISVHDGKLLGVTTQSEFSGKKYFSFFGVPYAEPPLGELRFKPPQKVKPWKGIKSACVEVECCIQFSLLKYRITGTENCLYMNIYTPELPSKNRSLKPVIVCIHPGGHIWGSAEKEVHGSPDFVMHHDIVYVVISYRLHILGFLNLNMRECSGNMGLKDIIMAFQWIKANIHYFNGNPENITAIGSSSGASTIHFLLLSPSVKGLFHKAILMGDYAFNCLVHYREESKTLAFELAFKLGFKGNNVIKLLRFYKSLPADVIASSIRIAQHIFHSKIGKLHPYGPFLPTIDQGVGAILPRSPRELIPNMEKVPLVVGFCEREAVCCFLGNQESVMKKYLNISNQNCWSWLNRIEPEKLRKIYEDIESFYFKETEFQKHDVLSINMDIQTDAALSEVYETVINNVSESYPVYVYKFEYEGELNFIKEQIVKLMFKSLTGSYHADDYNYWSCASQPKTKQTMKKVREFTKLLTNFAQFGNPSDELLAVDWKPSSIEHPCYLMIGDQLKEISHKLNGERASFWEGLKRRYENIEVH